MKNVERAYISKLLVKNNKGHVRKIVLAMSIALSVLYIAIFILFAFYMGIVGDIKKNKSSLAYEVTYGDDFMVRNGVDYSTYIDNAYYEDINDKYDDNINASYHIVSCENNYVFSASNPIIKRPIFYMDGLALAYNDSYLNSYSYSMLFFDMMDTNSFLSEIEEEYLKSNFGFAILGNGFSDAMNEVMVSSELLDSFGISYDEAIGKSLSMEQYLGNCILNNNYSRTFEASYYGEKYNVFNEYKIVGVYNSNISNLPLQFTQSPIWLKKESYYSSTNYTTFEDLGWDEYSITYNTDLYDVVDDAMSKNMVFIAPGYTTLYNELNPVITQRLSFDELSTAYRFYKYVNSLLTEEQLEYNNAISMNGILEAYIEYYPFIRCLIFGLIFVGCIVMIAAVVNLYVLMALDIKTNKQYLASMMASGANKKDISIIYLIYSLVISGISIIISGVVSAIISIIISYNTNSYLREKITSGISYSLNYGYYFLSFIIISFIVLLLSLLLAFVNTIKIRRSRLSNVLKNNE